MAKMCHEPGCSRLRPSQNENDPGIAPEAVFFFRSEGVLVDGFFHVFGHGVRVAFGGIFHVVGFRFHGIGLLIGDFA